jgi:hypothetical protein
MLACPRKDLPFCQKEAIIKNADEKQGVCGEGMGMLGGTDAIDRYAVWDDLLHAGEKAGEKL